MEKLREKLLKVCHSISFELVIVFIITFLCTLKLSLMCDDEIWSYGFSINIAKGLIPYKDFNMVIMPLYPMIQGLFMAILGKNMIVFHLFNAFFCTCIFYFLKKNFPKSYDLVYIMLLGTCFFFSNLFPSYNILILLLLLMILYYENKNSNKYDILIGIILGLIFITKQNMGVFLVIPSFFIKDHRRLVKRFIGYLIPCFLLFLYLIYNQCLYEFVDYTILGLWDFKNNIQITFYIIFFIISGLICGYCFVFLKDKSMTLKYLFCFNFLAYPLFDGPHVWFPFCLVIGYVAKKLIININFFKTFSLVYYGLLIILQLPKNNYINDGGLKYRKIDTDILNNISLKIDDYSKENEVFIFDKYAYVMKLYMNEDINKYDLINEGNMGLNGDKQYIKDFTNYCTDKKCMFLVAHKYNAEHQTNQLIVDYIKKNYYYYDTLDYFDVYANYEDNL